MSDRQQVDVSIVVPTYNEAENIPLLVKRLDDVLRGKYRYEIVIVDDNSPDGTAKVAQDLAREYPIKVIVRPSRLGLSSAIVEGMRHARGRYIVVIDADLQHPPEKIPELIKKLEEGCDIVVGSRRVKGGKDLGLRGIRKLISLGAAAIAWLLIPEVRNVRDIMSGFFALRREYSLTRTRLRGYKLLLELLLEAAREGATVCEVPIVFKRREKGRSKLTTREIFNYLRDVLYLSRKFVIKQVPLSILFPVCLILAPGGIYTIIAISIMFGILKYIIHDREVTAVGSAISTGIAALVYTILRIISPVNVVLSAVADFVLTAIFRK